MRTVASFVSGALALLALLAAVPLLWLSTHIVDEDGYVEFSSTLAKDTELQQAFSAYLTDELSARGVIPAALKTPAAAALSQTVERTSNEAGFIEAWEETQRSSHRQAFADPMPKTLGLDVSPMAAFVAKQAGRDLPVAIAVPKHLVVPVVTDASDREMVDRVEQSTTLGRIAGIVAVVAAVVCVALAQRTSTAVAWLGGGTLAVAGLLWVTSGPVSQNILDHTEAPSEFARTLQKLLVDRAASSLDAWLVVLAILGGIVTVAGLVGRAVTGRRTV
ncbi:hypothetical protein ASE12_13710 [Aeromicrobium sp. Root236]|uniref:hypothetical protein n=1 Tax=Aeromicrobium sp. Root236 TaxID=1736498 RepID=UPI0006F8C736|nr:hypothetical protein [Aeromicrobium sp. Root236]KRC65717.1 hypothetical protein ASE12_13710 [Aeromicrobium sp. Root236]